MTRDNLLTIKSIFKSVQRLKNVHFVREKTISAFKKCKPQIDELLNSNKKNDIKNSLMKIGKVDNFHSFEHILLGNKVIYSLKKKLDKGSKFKKRNKNGKFRQN